MSKIRVTHRFGTQNLQIRILLKIPVPTIPNLSLFTVYLPINDLFYVFAHTQTCLYTINFCHITHLPPLHRPNNRPSLPCARWDPKPSPTVWERPGLTQANARFPTRTSSQPNEP